MDKRPNSCSGRDTFRHGKFDVTVSWDTPSDRVIAKAARILREKMDRMPRDERTQAAELQLSEKEKSQIERAQYSPEMDA